jgi:hypothetical protein
MQFVIRSGTRGGDGHEDRLAYPCCRIKVLIWGNQLPSKNKAISVDDPLQDTALQILSSRRRCAISPWLDTFEKAFNAVPSTFRQRQA